MKLNTQCPTCEQWFFSRKARHHHQMTAHRPLCTEGQQKHRDQVRNRSEKIAREKAQALKLREKFQKSA